MGRETLFNGILFNDIYIYIYIYIFFSFDLRCSQERKAANFLHFGMSQISQIEALFEWCNFSLRRKDLKQAVVFWIWHYLHRIQTLIAESSDWFFKAATKGDSTFYLKWPDIFPKPVRPSMRPCLVLRGSSGFRSPKGDLDSLQISHSLKTF